MKPCHFFALLFGVVFLEGCATFQNRLTLDAIGPVPDENRVPGTNGLLMVYSAFDQHAHFNDGAYRRYHTDYQILSEQGQLLQVIHNDIGGVTEEPKPIELGPGRYRIAARANGYGCITVPILIVAREVTMVHLEGGASWSRDKPLASNSVRLPDGRIAGWQANQ